MKNNTNQKKKAAFIVDGYYLYLTGKKYFQNKEFLTYQIINNLVNII